MNGQGAYEIILMLNLICLVGTKIEAIRGYHFVWTEMVLIMQKGTGVYENVEKWEHLYVAGGNRKWYSFSIKIKKQGKKKLRMNK